jgi:hypothetical protein
MAALETALEALDLLGQMVAGLHERVARLEEVDYQPFPRLPWRRKETSLSTFKRGEPHGQIAAYKSAAGRSASRAGRQAYRIVKG